MSDSQRLIRKDTDGTPNSTRVSMKYFLVLWVLVCGFVSLYAFSAATRQVGVPGYTIAFDQWRSAGSAAILALIPLVLRDIDLQLIYIFVATLVTSLFYLPLLFNNLDVETTRTTFGLPLTMVQGGSWFCMFLAAGALFFCQRGRLLREKNERAATN